ncbi:MAG: chitobiase/beta-hexosaminidase C-terminal domain-containing protein, partial [Terracidiphilus sp.]
MNRISRVLVSLTYVLTVLTIACTPVVGRSATTVATPAFSLAAGSYTGTQSVTLSDATSGATIYYTTNGTTPSNTSTKYTGSIAVSTSETIKAIAELTGDTNSAVASAAYTITVPTPAFTPATGTYHSAQSVTLSDATSGATIYYTTNGKTPSSASTKYTGTITVSTSETIQAIAELTGDTNSAVSTATYTFQAPTPTFSLPTGSYAGSLSVTISDANSTATIYYTTNGKTPTTASTIYTAGTAITVNATETLEAIAVVTGYANSAPASATYTISTTPGTLTVYLSQPGAQSTTVVGAATETFDALSTANPHTSPYLSTAGIGTYGGSATNPFAILSHDMYGGAIDSSSNGAATNYYAVGKASNSTNAAYLTFTQPVSYFGFWWSAGDAYNRVAIYSGNTLCGSFSTADLLSFLKNGTGTITALNGSTYKTSAYFGNPNLASGSNDSTEPFAYVSFSITGVMITQVAFYNTSTSSSFESDNHSAIFSGNTVTIPTTFAKVETLTLGSQVAAPIFTPEGGIPLNLEISSTTPGASISYTIDGSTPTTTGTACNTPTTPCTIQVTAAETIKAIAYETGITNSPVTSVTYTMPTLSVVSSSNPSIYGTPVTFTATISSGPTGTVTFYDSGSSIGTGTISGAKATLTISTLAIGAHTITAGWVGNASYGSVLSSAITQTVSKEAQTINFPNPGVQTIGTPLALSATASSGLAVTFTSATNLICTVSGTTASFIAAGTCTIDANQPGNGTYAAAPQVAQSFTVKALQVSVSVTPITATLAQGQTLQFNATVANTSNQTVNWTLSPTTGEGAINATGLYTAPASITSQQSVAVITTSAADSTKSATASVTLTPISPFTGPAGTVVTITGVGFGSAEGASSVTVGGLPAVALGWSDTQIQVQIPSGTGLGAQNLVVTVGDQVVTNAAFTVTSGLVGITPSPTGTTASVTFNAPVEQAPLIFTASAGQWASVVLSNPSQKCGFNISILDSNNNTLGNTGSANSSIFQPPVALTGNNEPYTVAIVPQYGCTTSATFTLYVFNEQVGTITSGVPVPINFTIPGQDAELTFSGTLGQLASVLISNPLQNCGFNIGIKDAGGTYLFSTGAGGNPINVNSGPLPGNENYTLVIVPQYGCTTSITTTLNESVSSITVTPTSTTLYSGQTQQFTATVNGALNTNVTWKLTPATGAGAISSTGIYTPPAVISTQQKVTITATTNMSNPSQSASATLTLVPFSVTVIPPTMMLYGGQTQQFTATANGVANTNATWTLTPTTGAGAISSTGFYSAPPVISAQQKVTITATNIGTATVTLMPPPPPIALAAASQPPYMIGSSQGFIATIEDQYGTPKPGIVVTFTVTGSNANTGSVITDSNGIASFAYIGANSGNDTIQAAATVNGQQLTSNSVSVSWNSPPAANTEGSVTLQTMVNLGLSGLCGAFTDSNGAVIEPIAIGAAPRVFVVPVGATQLQLGIDDDGYGDNSGSGFVVEVNGVMNTVLPTSMPWNWVAGGLNTDYKWGILDGTSPIVALTDLTQGAEVSIVYQSGTVSASYPTFPYVNADGGQKNITGVNTGNTETHFPTLYMTSSSYPVGQPIPISALVTNGSGTPLANVQVMLNITGANAREIEATTDSSGTATFTYVGMNAGTDMIEARAYPTGEASLLSNQSSVTWTSPASLPPLGSLTLTPNTIQPLPVGGQQAFTVLATDASGSPIPNNRVSLHISGADNPDIIGTTDATGHATFIYQDVNPGIASVVATAFIDNLLVYSNQVSVPWTLPPTPTNTACESGALSIGISALNMVALPNALPLNGSVTDSNTITSINWSKSSGPGTVTFTPSSQQAVTTATFSEAGDYVLELNVNDNAPNTCSLPWPVKVNLPETTPGWVGSPLNNSMVTGVVPITLASGVTLQSGAQNPPNTLTYYPANNPSNVTSLPITAESGQIATLDTTTLANGTYWIQLQATNTSGNTEYSLVMVTVAGNYKPGRVTATVTDLVVPSTGLAINIQRTYDSLNAGTSGDFGYGWNLGINVNLVVDPKGDVTFTLNGQRKTFYLTPQIPFCDALFGCFLPIYFVVYTPEPGLYGTLTDSGPGCADLFDVLGSDGYCTDGGPFSPPGYIYTDPNGTAYTISAAGNLQSIQDRSGNGLTITANGITSTTGLNVPFKRDANNRIYEIDDPKGNKYQYGYDANGNLATVTYPATPAAPTCPGASATNTSQYTYHTELPYPYNHLYKGGTDGLCNPLPISTYYGAHATDGNGNSLNGRLQSVTDATGNTTSYAYTLSTTSTINGVSFPNTGVTTITYPQNPADGNGAVATATMIYDSYGDLLQSTDPLGNTTINAYDSNHNLTSVIDPLGHTSTYAYDTNGNKTSSTYPVTATSVNTTSTTAYNQYSEPTSTTDEIGNTRTFNYDTNSNPQSVTDSIGTLASFLFNPNGELNAGAIGYDAYAQPAKASFFTYDTYGNMTSRTDALGRSTIYTYDSLGRKQTMITPTPTAGIGGSASTTNYQYDALGNVIETDAPLGRKTYSTYDANGNKTSDTDADGNVTYYIYDALNRLIETDYPSNATTPATKSTIKSYDFRNNVVDAIDQAGNDTHYTYDLAGRLSTVTRGFGSSTPSTTSYQYDAAGRKTSETQAYGTPNAATTSYTYDADNRLTAISGAAGNFQYGYDDPGNRTSSTDGNGHKTVYQYDARKRLIETDYPDISSANPNGTSVKNTYDGPGNLASVTDQAGNVVTYNYDAANQLIGVVQNNSPYSAPQNTNTYGYDPLGNLTGLTDERGDTTTNLFNVLNEQTQKTLPDTTHTESRTYDTAGNLTSLTHFDGYTTTYTYDALNRLTSRSSNSPNAEPPVSFTYTPTGKYLTSTAQDGTVNYYYDALDRLTSKVTPEGTLRYTYYASGKVESITSSNANGTSVSYTYDDLNRLSTVVDGHLQGNQTTAYSYDTASNVAEVTYPNNLTSKFTYDALNRLTALSTSTSPVSSYN